MIFLTVGTGLPFDALVAEADRLAGLGVFSSPLTCQIGNGTYEPQHGDFFRYSKNIRSLIRDADLVILHGGMTVYECLMFGTPFITFPNRTVADDHQYHFLEKLSSVLPVNWSPDPGDLEACYKRRDRYRPDTDGLQCLYGDLKAYLLDQKTA
ncbi:glycosyltransferase [Eilatimonas milleporae]|uniref:UDP-N-acetylglucosamine transferase subunit ALG13 n=1 Tax=Eilatimonas milleporae TaxID=911205 RepID=A0A3M0C6T1_9PROT|nr:glycosyltransferase [Eilatimonas milleporae]RMB04387.1 UDP-N-acetylglucosamine transferase subunit ALG13 [Eilatimonas milleporae]